MEAMLNQVLKAESAQQLNAENYERSAERLDYRNGSRERSLTTRIGKIELHVPRHRNVPFRTMLFENYQRNEQALISTMMEMVVQGVSTRKVQKVTEELCGEAFSKSTVSEICKELDIPVKQFKERLLPDHYPFIVVDAIYLKAREDHRVHFHMEIDFVKHHVAYSKHFYPGAYLKDNKVVCFDTNDWYEILRFCHFVLSNA